MNSLNVVMFLSMLIMCWSISYTVYVVKDTVDLEYIVILNIRMLKYCSPSNSELSISIHHFDVKTVRSSGNFQSAFICIGCLKTGRN